MRRVVFIVLWMIAFASFAFSISMFTFAMIGWIGAAQFEDSVVALIGKLLSYAFFGLPFIALILGLFGVLPGTRRRI